jgi:hypothetical protein
VFLVHADGRDLRTLSDRAPLPSSGVIEPPQPRGSGAFNLPVTPFDALALTRNLDEFADAMQEQAQEEQAFDALVAGSTAVVTTGLTVGYLVWALRGGSLLATMISSLPAWTLIDPLPILNSFEPRPDQDDEGGEPDDSIAAGWLRGGGTANTANTANAAKSTDAVNATGRDR